MGDLPSFKKPPVVETVLGVQFDPVPGFKNAHLGLFWDTFDDAWNDVDEQPTLAAQFEEFPASWAAMGAQLMLTQDPACRLRIRNPGGKRMLQVQNGRLHLNWLGGGAYPRYKVVRPEFDAIVVRFQEFLATRKLEELVPNQWEVTYVNHVPAGPLWKAPDEWGAVFPGLGPSGARTSMVSAEVFAANWQYEIMPQLGRLHIEINHGKSKKNGEDVIIAKLTARGAIAGDGELTLGAGLDLGHECIVRTFTEVTSKEAHEFWERER